jgi:hypothetical protein
MSRIGIASLPLHGGKAPAWLTGRMRKLAKEMATIMVDEYGSDRFLVRLSDPFWFQALGCVLGYDWHSSGVTTVVTGVLKQALSIEEHGMAVCGGKGKTSRKTPTEICEVGTKLGFSEKQVQDFTYTSRITAKVDNAAIQAGYQLYHHTFFLTKNAKWAVIQQGMDPIDRTARRYHWLSDNTENFVIEPHNAIVGDTKRSEALNMTARASEGCQKASVDIAKEPTRKLRSLFEDTRPLYQKSLEAWLQPVEHSIHRANPLEVLRMPRNINWDKMKDLYEFQPQNYEELLSISGVGPATVRGLALVAELVFGEKPSWEDPVKYSFAFGGKDGVPFPVDRKAMDESISVLRETVQAAKVGEREKLNSLQRLRQFVPESANS